MKHSVYFVLASVWLASCQSNSSWDQVVSQTFVHKYGFETTEQDWQAREKDGQVVSILKNGVKITRSYENGVLHGPTTYTLPHSSVVEKDLIYDQGTLLKKRENDDKGMPIKEEVYEFDNRIIVTYWDEKGVPLSVEEFKDGNLIEGKYYTSDHELEASVIAGTGERIKRDRTGLLTSKDEIVDSAMVTRTTFHPNGNIHTISHYDQYDLHGKQLKFTALGRPLMELNWDHNVLHGEKIIYRNGMKIAVIPYDHGKKNGIELHYDDLGNLTAEIEWRNDKKHGTTTLYSEDFSETEWFYKGQSVNANRYEMLENRALLTPDNYGQ